MTKKLFILLVVTVVSLGLTSLGISAGMGEEVNGTVTKIEGGKVTIKGAMGDEKTVEPKNPEALKEIKVGDQVSVKDGKLTKAGGSGSSAPSPEKKY
ncbi:MAG: hypothetical protein A2Z40_01585 [Deltaproteobacteria bacterium RBG_19FT_COMBO_60_16]|nr:MAG: hypothetical protein A2Z40_01585 [Deltaproteobacteria bacterium RBG_19FT_COMBO_60_16]